MVFYVCFLVGIGLLFGNLYGDEELVGGVCGFYDVGVCVVCCGDFENLL